mmetsp:Transcript_43986/g.134009  ORF Transcript_43986/g.134009 Transcript_43986/m.134009 type:complete len:692 (-) Transcript_43986:73-2148(-)
MKQVASYATIVGLAGQASRFSSSMNVHLVLMSDATLQSSTLQTKAGFDADEASALEEKATADTERSGGLREEAAALRVQAEEDAASAAGDEAEAAALADEAGVATAEAEVQLAAAAEEEVLAETAEALAAEEAAAAAESEVEAAEDAAAVAVCEFVPFLDVLCDVVGAATEIGLHAAAAAQAAESAAEVVAAVVARAEEDAELTSAAALQADASEAAAASAELETKAAEEEAKSEAEYADAERDDLEADALMARSEAAEADAAEEEIEAAAEEAGADKSLGEAARHGIAALRDAFQAGLASVMALVFFGWRLVTRYLIPAIVGGWNKFSRSQAPVEYRDAVTTRPPKTHFHFMRIPQSAWPHQTVSTCILHVSCFLAALATLELQWSEYATCSRRARGGTILLFGCIAACAQGLALHALPRLRHDVNTNVQNWPTCERMVDDNSNIQIKSNYEVPGSSMNRCHGLATVVLSTGREFLVGFTFLFPLFVMEALTILVLFGHQSFVMTIRPILWWLLFAISMSLHFWWFEITMNSARNDEEFESATIMATRHIDEGTRLLQGSSDNEPDCHNVESHSNLSHGSLVSEKELGVIMTGNEPKKSSWQNASTAIKSYVHDLHTPFEVLVLCCMLALLHCCMPMFLQLLPLYKLSPLSSTAIIGFCTVFVLIGLYAMCLTILRSRSRHVRGEMKSFD